MDFLSWLLSFILSWQVLALTIGSGFLAVIIYLMGIRTGKDSADRAALREIYQKLFSHFKELSDRVDGDIPKQYTAWRNRNNDYALPVKEMADNGSLQLLPAFFAKRAKDTEESYLMAAHAWKTAVERDMVPMITSKFSETFKGEHKSKNGMRYHAFHANRLLLWDDEKFNKFADLICKDDIGFGMELAQETNKSNQLTVYPAEYGAEAIRAFFKDIRKVVQATPSITEPTKKLFEERDKIDALVIVLTNRIRDPNPFWQTVIAAAKEPFRR
jgi:hypothetical protein